jgi:putative transposase
MLSIRKDISAENVYKQAQKEKSGKVRARLLGIAAILENKSRSYAAKIAGLTINNIRTWVRRFNTNGLNGLSDKKQKGRKPKWTSEIVQYIQDKAALGACFERDKRVTFRLIDFQLELKDKFGQHFGLSTIWYKLKELKLSWITVRKQHPKSDLKAQEEFKKKIPVKIKEIQEQYPDKQIEVWFQDEARVGQHGTLTRIWAPKGSRPRALCDFRFKSAYIFGAICPALKKASALIFTAVGAKEMNAHLKEISNTLAKNVQAVIIMDRAPWHKSVIKPNNISILYLLSYSPELNPVEQVWDFLRSNYLSNRIYETVDQIFNACCEAWQSFVGQPDLISSIGMRSWIN